MRDLQARSLKKACFIAALFSMMLSAAPAFAQTVTATWDASPSTDQVTSYQVCVATTSQGTCVSGGPVSVPASTTRYTFSPTAGVLHFVRIRAVNSLGPSAYSNEISFSIPNLSQPSNQSSMVGVAVGPLNLTVVDPDASPRAFSQTGLPPGLSINSSTGQIAGTPSVAGVYGPTVFVNDGIATVARTFLWTVIFDQSSIPVGFGSGKSADFDGDGRADIWAYQKSNLQGTWNVRGSVNLNRGNYQWGADTDVPVPGDYDGDRRADYAVYRPSNGIWYVRRSSANNNTWFSYQWGAANDIPVPGDYDGDRRTDIAVYRPSNGTWYIARSTANYANWVSPQWGVATDIPVPADYDGDGRTDVAVYRPSTGVWYIQRSGSSNSWVSYQWGSATDVVVPSDYDGDGRADLAVYRPSTGMWYILRSNSNYNVASAFHWGASTDIPMPGDYDGDGLTDIAVYRPSVGTWFFMMSSVNYLSTSYIWGQ